MKFVGFLYKEPLTSTYKTVNSKLEGTQNTQNTEKKIQSNDTGTEHRKKGNVP